MCITGQREEQEGKSDDKRSAEEKRRSGKGGGKYGHDGYAMAFVDHAKKNTIEHLT